MQIYMNIDIEIDIDTEMDMHGNWATYNLSTAEAD
jgi:hypothetical protein